ncbi:MAG: hypothetical protein JRN06_11370 [Nitrososphaerota archaeon]|nr:hypothetical protein [Nitrososphaerota archaeon]MDG7024717.1 hypothetical protein [Nitrososphaerota archaeon]
MRALSTDESLQNTLDWALDRMRQKGYDVKSKVTLNVEPSLAIMGYAKKEGEVHRIMISEWALDSEMLGGLVLHELSHVYFTEQGASSHDSGILESVLEDLKERDGLRAKETEHLIDAFNHLQNVLVDDLVFEVMGEKEHDMVKRFFAEWISDSPSGDPVTDASLLCRNAFAVASLRRRKLVEWGAKGDQEDAEMYFRNKSLLDALGHHADEEFDWLEGFLEKSKLGLSEAEFRESLEAYFDRVLSLMRSSSKLDDLR